VQTPRSKIAGGKFPTDHYAFTKQKVPDTFFRVLQIRRAIALCAVERIVSILVISIKIMQRKSLWVAGVVALVLASLSGGYLYAAQGGASAQDKKQLGLFNGNDEFIGTLIGMQADDTMGGTEYKAYLESKDAIISIATQGGLTNGAFPLVANVLYFSEPNCAGNGYIGAIDGDLTPIVPQILVASGDANRQFVVTTGVYLSNIPTLSVMDLAGLCTNFPSIVFHDNVVQSREVNLSYVLAGQPRIKTL
jgi:hypothetical protein